MNFPNKCGKKKQNSNAFFGMVFWDPQENLLLSKNTNFEVNPNRTEGTYSKYASLDDKLTDFITTRCSLNLN